MDGQDIPVARVDDEEKLKALRESTYIGLQEIEYLLRKHRTIKRIAIYKGHFLPKMASFFFPVAAITVGTSIFTREEEPSLRLMNHELIHVDQMSNLGTIKFLFLYVYYFLKALPRSDWNPYEAYLEIPFEKEAYSHDKDRTYYFRRSPGDWKKYI
jgi:hypothetical protein